MDSETLMQNAHKFGAAVMSKWHAGGLTMTRQQMQCHSITIVVPKIMRLQQRT